MKIVTCEPGKFARVETIGDELEDLQKVVDGYIEPIRPFEDPSVVLVLNEEGKLRQLPPNRAFSDGGRFMSYGEMANAFRSVENEGRAHMNGFITFTEYSFTKPYGDIARTYLVTSNNKAYQPNMGGYSIHGWCIDGSDPGVRLEAYMAAEKGGANGWKVERCYVPGVIQDILVGTFFLCRKEGSEFASLTDEQIEKFLDKFRYPEKFVQVGEKTILNCPVKEEFQVPRRCS